MSELESNKPIFSGTTVAQNAPSTCDTKSQSGAFLDRADIERKGPPADSTTAEHKPCCKDASLNEHGSQSPGDPVKHPLGCGLSFYYPLFEHMSDNHGLTLLDGELADILEAAKPLIESAALASAERLEKDHDREIGDFQNQVRELILKLTGAPDNAIDGKGSDAGWQEFTLAEISQGISWQQDRIAKLEKVMGEIAKKIDTARLYQEQEHLLEEALTAINGVLTKP